MQKFKRTRTEINEPVVSIRDGRFNYSSTFSKLTQLEKYHYVSYYVDEEKREIGFSFTEERVDSDAYLIGKSPGKSNNFRSSAGELIRQLNWVSIIHDSGNSDQKNFIAFKRGNLWVIQIRPSFEIRLPRELISEIPFDHSGIYRYVDNKNNLESGQVVYIGKGFVRKRLQEQPRKEWVFNEIQYSIIAEEDLQYEWENYWILQHKSINNGRLPYYNNNSGHSKKL